MALNVGVLLFIPYRAMENEIIRAVREAGHGDITLAQARLFQRIAPGGSRLTDLAEQAQVTKQTAGVLVDQLQETGYVRRVPDPSDGRARLITFTERGEAACAVANGAAAALEAEWTRHLGEARMEGLREALEHLREITDPYG